MKETIFIALSNNNILTIDLHKSDNVVNALEQLEKELFFIFKKNEKYCKVIYGVGSGVLKNKVLEALDKNPMVKDFFESADGYCIVEF